MQYAPLALRRAGLLVVLGALGVGCDRAGSAGVPAASSAAPALSAQVAASALAPSPSATAAPATPAATVRQAGAWSGRLDAARIALADIDKLAAKDRAGDDGRAGAGAVELTLTVALDGQVTGQATGALGSAALSGWVDASDGALSASWVGAAGDAGSTFAGLLSLAEKGDALVGTLRVASPDARLVRGGDVELRRAAPAGATSRPAR